MIKRTKNFISFFVSAFIVLSISVSAFADPLTGALIAAMDGIGVVVGGVGLTPDIVDTQVGDPTRTDIPGVLDDASVYYKPHAVSIDGVDYDRILYSPEFAEYLNEEGLGWILDKSINPDSQGTLASGAGTCGGVPIFLVNNELRSQYYTFPFPDRPVDDDHREYLTEVVGSFYIWTTTAFNWNRYINISLSAGQPQFTVLGSSVTEYSIYCGTNSTPLQIGYWTQNRNTTQITQFSTAPFINEPFSFDYVSGTIDTGSKEGLNLEVLIPSGTITDIPEGNYIVDGATGTETIKLIDEGIVNTIVNGDEPVSNYIEPAPVPTPTPTPVPIPTDALGLVPTTTWMDIFGTAVKQGIENINDTIGLFKQDVVDFFDTVGQGIQTAIEDVFDLVGLFKEEVLDTLDTWGQAIEDGLENLGDIFNTGITTLRGILEAIRTAVATITSTLTDVLDHIKQGHLDLFQPVFDGIKIVFAPVLVLLKSALRLWHYVVEWVQATAPVFSTFFGFMSGTNYNMVLPIYAALAGPICIAIYKRFGR